jgi:hypothetical protein
MTGLPADKALAPPSRRPVCPFLGIAERLGLGHALNQRNSAAGLLRRRFVETALPCVGITRQCRVVAQLGFYDLQGWKEGSHCPFMEAKLHWPSIYV